MKKVHIIPPPHKGDDPGLGGVQRVILGQVESLPAHGWEYEPDPFAADVIACHIEVPETYLRIHGAKPLVVHNHGLYWSGYEWAQWSHKVNDKVLAAIRVADVVTAVSAWTANAIRRHSNRDVRVIYNGIDPEEWQPASDGGRGYGLWNKTRVDPICDPAPFNALAERMPDVPFVSTYGDPAPNVSLLGTIPFEHAKEWIRYAGFYLATTRETFGIGTLEAMAAGVPVVGYRWGGQREIVTHGVDGWLVQPDNIDGLVEGARWALANREAIGARAREKALTFSNDAAAAKYAALYDEALARTQAQAQAPRTSIIVPAYKLAEYLPATLDSVLRQRDEDWECIVVDDASPDRCGEIAEEYAAADPRIRVIHNETNLYLAGARNAGIAAARGRYVLPLDADDQISPITVGVLADALDADRGFDIAYGNVRFTEEDGATPTVYPGAFAPGHSGWPIPFDLDMQLEGPGQLLPYSSMYRRRVWELTGGYRRRARSSEDCDMWLRTTSYGFVPRMVTTADTLIYRNREDSMSRSEGWEEHRPWYPWVEDRTLLPAAGVRESSDELPNVPALDPPWVAVVIPVGPGHGALVMDAIDSVDAQTFRDWECIVVNDSGEELPPLPQWVRVIEPEDGRFGGVAAARNAAIRASRSPLFLPLDADDFLQPTALQLMIDAHLDEVGGHRPIVYSDFWEDPGAEGEFKVFVTPDFDPAILVQRGMLHAVTALTPRAVWDDVGGYAEDLPAWEDWAFALSAAARGHCSRRIAAPLFSYRKHTGMRAAANFDDFEESKEAMMARDYGGAIVGCSRCPGGRSTAYMGGPANGQAAPLAQPSPAIAGGAGPPFEGEALVVEYTGNRAGNVDYKGEGGRIYRFSARRRRGWVRPVDVTIFTMRPDFHLVEAASGIGVPEAPPLVAVGAPRAAVVEPIAVAAPPAPVPPTLHPLPPVAPPAPAAPLMAPAPVAPSIPEPTAPPPVASVETPAPAPAPATVATPPAVSLPPPPPGSDAEAAAATAADAQAAADPRLAAAMAGEAQPTAVPQAPEGGWDTASLMALRRVDLNVLAGAHGVANAPGMPSKMQVSTEILRSVRAHAGAGA